MTSRQQYLKYCAHLGWISEQQLQQISQENISFEEFVESNRLFTATQWDGLQFILMNLVFLKAAQSLGALTQQQAEELLREKASEIQQGKLIASLKPLQQKMIPIRSIPQIVSCMRQQHVLTDAEISRILSLIQPYYAQAKPQTVPEAKTVEINVLKTIGNYEIVEEIATGGMGKVYKAYEPKLDRYVAIKIMLNQSLQIAQQRFLEEARLTAKLQHSNIVTIHDINSQDGMDYIVMDYIEGKALDDVLLSGVLPITKTLKIMQAVASAIAHAHDNKVIHRDLKPANIIIKTDGQPIVMDFGLAKNLEVATGITIAGQILGTPRYMAPEQVLTKPATHLSDIYALGVILYEMITGVPVVTAETMAQVVYQVTQQPIVPPRKINPQIPQHLENICLKAMAKAPKNRYQSGHELAAALGQLRSSSPARVFKKARSIQQQNKGRSVYVAAGVVAIFLSIVSYFLLSPKTDYLKQAEQYIQQRNYQKALVLLVQEIETNPNNIDALNQRGIVYEELEEFDKALADYQAAIHLDKDYYRAYSRIAGVYLKQKKYDKGQEYVSQAIKLNPIYYEAHLYRGKLYSAQENYEKAIICFSIAIDVDSKYRHAYVDRGHCYLELQQWDKAIRDFNEAIQSFPDATEMYYNRGIAHGQKQNYTEALSDFNKAISLDNKHVKAYINRGYIYALQKKFPLALSDYNHSITISPRAKAYSNRGDIYHFQKKYSLAQADYNKAIEIDNTNPTTYSKRGSLFFKQNNFSKAIADFSIAISLNPTLTDVYLQRAYVYQKQLGAQDLAIKDFEKVLQLSPNHPYAPNIRNFIETLSK